MFSHGSSDGNRGTVDGALTDASDPILPSSPWLLIPTDVSELDSVVSGGEKHELGWD